MGADRILIFHIRKLRFREVKRFEKLVAKGGAVNKMNPKAIHPFSLIPLLVQLLWPCGQGRGQMEKTDADSALVMSKQQGLAFICLQLDLIRTLDW